MAVRRIERTAIIGHTKEGQTGDAIYGNGRNLVHERKISMPVAIRYPQQGPWDMGREGVAGNSEGWKAQKEFPEFGEFPDGQQPTPS
jgi:hypothetical protein